MLAFFLGPAECLPITTKDQLFIILVKLRQAKNDVELGGYISVRTKVAAGDSHWREEILLYYMM